MTNVDLPEFWKWVVQKERNEKAKENSNFEPQPLYIEHNIPQKPTAADEKADHGDGESVVDHTVYQF